LCAWAPQTQGIRPGFYRAHPLQTAPMAPEAPSGASPTLSGCRAGTPPWCRRRPGP